MPTKLRFFNMQFPSLNLSGKNRTEPLAGSDATATTLADPPDIVTQEIPAPVEETVAPAPPTSSPDSYRAERPGSGLHDILKNTDYGFNLELSLLEKYAINSAVLHAQAGLPHQDVPAIEELEAEKVLRVRAAEIFLDWSSKVRRKVQDAIQIATVRVGDGLVQLRHTFDQLDLTRQNIKDVQSSLALCENRSEGVQKTVEYGSLIRGRFYWGMFAILALVDWVANVPIFMQLLPHDPGAERRYQDFVGSAGKYGMFDGIMILIHRQVSAPEVSLLALGIVVILMFLCHGCGKSLRKLIAYRTQDEPMIELGIRSQRRQAWISFGATATAVLLAVTFLFLSRGRIEEVTGKQSADIAAQVQTLTAKLQAIQEKGNPQDVEAASEELDAAKAKQKEREETHNYATGIKSMNSALGILNIVLVLAAISAAYMHDNGRITEVAFGDPKMIALEAQLRGYREESIGLRSRIRTLDTEVQANIAQAKFLAQSAPLREWSAKSARLASVVPLFRSENARHRGTDVQLIKGFSEVRLPDITPPDIEPFRLPEELHIWEKELASVRVEIDRLQTRTKSDTGVGA